VKTRELRTVRIYRTKIKEKKRGRRIIKEVKGKR
jgi:hypothetical protein